MITVDEALHRISNMVNVCAEETIKLERGAGRCLSRNVVAQITHPPTDVSAMDGYAIRHQNPSSQSLPSQPPPPHGTEFTVIGEAPAGHPFHGKVNGGEAVRVFTGSVVPENTTHVVIQENTIQHAEKITLTADQNEVTNIRTAGGDFSEGDILAAKGATLTPARLGLLAAANIAKVTVRKKPRIALIANGDELLPPGSKVGPGQVINSAPYALAPLYENLGCDVDVLGIAPDTEAGIEALLDEATEANLIIPIGGASVGDYDYMKSAARKRFTLHFEKVAVKPGKPVWFGSNDDKIILGVPGNPASALTCSILFGSKVIQKMLGQDKKTNTYKVRTNTEISKNGPREHYMRGACYVSANGELMVSAMEHQDSSLLRPYAMANALIKRSPNEKASAAGDLVSVLLFEEI